MDDTYRDYILKQIKSLKIQQENYLNRSRMFLDVANDIQKEIDGLQKMIDEMEKEGQS